jgi:hypothetical protein
MTDLEHWGTIEKWSYPDDGYGDCEDYVLLKRRLPRMSGSLLAILGQFRLPLPASAAGNRALEE